MKPVKTHPLPNGRLQSIDALRGIAALGVVLYHAVMQTTKAVPNNLFRWPVKLLQFVSSFGYIGVVLFFVISGFCIHLQWAIAVESAFGLVKLPKRCRNLSSGGAAIVLASTISRILPITPKDTLPHDLAWMLLHPAWGVGFFILVNRAVAAEQSWLAKLDQQRVISRIVIRMVAAAAFVGVFSDSLYLTHELIIMQSWWFVIQTFPPILNALLIVIPATVMFAWLFFRFCEKPYMRKAVPGAVRTEESSTEATTSVFAQALPAMADEA